MLPANMCGMSMAWIVPYDIVEETRAKLIEILNRRLADADTADTFTEISRGIDKWLWFVEAHLQAES